MRILHIDQHYHYSGGTEQYYLDVMEMLEQKGHHVVAAYGVEDAHTLRNSHRSAHHIPGIEAVLPHDQRETLRRAESVVETERPELIHVHNVRNFRVIELLSRLRPTVRFVHDPTLCCFRDWKLLPDLERICTYRIGWRCQLTGCLKDYPIDPLRAIIWKRRELRIHRSLARLLVASTYMKNLLVSNGIPASHVSILPHPTELPALEDIDASPPDNMVLFVGLLHPNKGVDKLIRALAMVHAEFTAHFVGNGPFVDDYTKLARAEGLGDRVRFTGWVKHDEISAYYARASVVVMPSWWIEAFGIVGIEAMAHGKPVVAFDTGGISDWLEDGATGFLVKRGDIREMAEKIQLLLENKDLAKRMGKRAREIANDKFEKSSYLDRLLNVYESIMTGR